MSRMSYLRDLLFPPKCAACHTLLKWSAPTEESAPSLCPACLAEWESEELETCGICCILMAQQAFGIDHATVAKQMAYYDDYGAKSTAGTLGATIAYVLYMKGHLKALNVKIVHGSENFLENRGEQGPYFAPEKFEKILNSEFFFYENR